MSDLYSDRAYDDNMELLCTAPDELPTNDPDAVPPAIPEGMDFSDLPVLCLSAAMVDIARTAASASRTQFMRESDYELKECTD